MRKICVVTGSRAEYGLLAGLLKSIQNDADLNLQLIVTGMHLSPEFGLTWRQIVDDGLPISYKVEMLLSADTPAGISKSMGLGLIGFADALRELLPDILVVLGDRYEIFAAVQAAMNQRLIVAHIHGGELTEGAVDDAIRHAITKIAHLHFTATDTYRRRVIQLGEQPDRVFNVGALGLDAIRNLPLLDKSQLENILDFHFGTRNLLVTFHPATLETVPAEEQFRELLQALDSFDDTHILFTYANADAGGRAIIAMIEAYRQRYPHRVASFVSMGAINYLSAMRLVDAVVGNSSSGILEAPAFGIATVNIGDRQRGRLSPGSVMHCPPEAQAIRRALQTVFSGAFADCLSRFDNPYDQGGATEKIKQVLKHVHLDGLQKKQFYDITGFEEDG